ncbi:cobalt ECF transporter T component CbiQ [Thalassiella azotivora]
MTAGPAVDVAAWAGPWRHRSPADKLLLCGGGVVAVTVLPPLPTVPVVLVAALVLALGPARVPPATLGRALAAPAVFLLTAALPLLLDARWDGGPAFAVTAETVARTAEVLGRSAAATAAVLLLACTTPMSDLLPRLRRVGAPQAVVDVAALVYRMLFELLDAVATVRAARAARLAPTGARALTRDAAAVVVAVLLRAWTRAQRLEEGLAGRGGPSLVVLPEDRPSSRRFVVASLGGLAALTASALVLAHAGATTGSRW